MTDEEYLLLDELYFIIDFKNLAEQSEISEKRLRQLLKVFYATGWVRCFDKDGEELHMSPETMQDNLMEYQYLISKEGLFAHHRKS